MAPFEPDPQQRGVLEHASGPMLVTGDFGTGKTAVARERFARLIEDGADPERAALVVGSRRARDEARDELLERLGTALPSLIVVTIHGLAYHVVGQRYAELGYDEPPRVLGADDQFARVRELLLGEDPGDWPAYGALLALRGFADQVRQFAIRAQEALLSPDDIAERAGDATGWRELAAFLRTYVSVLDAAGEVDFAGLVQQASRAAGRGPPPFDHVIVDDHQDTTLAAERLLAELRPASLVVAGHLGGHVFSFQGTTDEPFRRFAERNPGAVRVELVTDHRPRPARVEAWRAAHVSEQHQAVARELRRIHADEGVPWRDLAVIVRRQGPRVEGMLRALDDASVPRATHGSGSPAHVPATRPFVLAFRWLCAGPERREQLAEQLLTSEIGRLSPASARTLLRLVRAMDHPASDALELDSLLPGEDGARLVHLKGVLDRAAAARASALDAFRILWTELPYARELVERAETDRRARADLDAVVRFSQALGEREGDPSVEAFLASLQPAEGGPELAAGRERAEAVEVLTAHAVAGREFDTVFVLDVLEGDFPSLSRPEPMFDLQTMGTVRARAEINRARLADERRLFTMVHRRARRRVVLAATEPSGDAGITITSRFVDELGVPWTSIPTDPAPEPASIAEAAALWRRTLADPAATRVERLACVEGLLQLGQDPAAWWFQHEWTDLSAPKRDELHLSYSRLSVLENCELQFVLSSELGLDPLGGYQAWVGKLMHQLIEDCEAGKIGRTPEAFRAAIDERWDPARFPSRAISEAERQSAKEVMVPNWFSGYGGRPATATERSFSFPFDGATIRGKIDRIGPALSGGTRITDYKSGRSDNAGKPSASLQLGIYYLAVGACEDLAEHRPIEAVELAFLSGSRKDDGLDVREWPVTAENEESYQAEMRERVSHLIGRIRELDGSRAYVASTKASCFFCGFRALCPRYPQGGEVFPLQGPTPAEPA
jgi:superfamily I DNA/RNA helicase/RecB family exonuclease